MDPLDYEALVPLVVLVNDRVQLGLHFVALLLVPYQSPLFLLLDFGAHVLSGFVGRGEEDRHLLL